MVPVASAIAGRAGAQRGASAILPDAGLRHTRRRTLRLDAQHPLDHLELGVIVAADVGQPALVDRAVIDPIERAGDAACQRHSDLRAEAGRQVEGILHRVAPAAAERQRPKVGVGLLQVRHRRHNPILEDLERDHILDAYAHRVAGEPLGVGHHDLAGRRAEGVAQRGDLGRSAAAAGGGIGLVRDEHRLCGNCAPIDAEAALGRVHQPIHHLCDMVDIQTCAVERAVASLTTEQLDHAAHPALAHGIFTLDQERAGAHAQDHTVAAPVERQRCLLDPVVGGGGAGGQKARADPAEVKLAGHIIGGDHQHTAAAARANPILGQCDALGGTGTGRVHLRVRATRADILGKLAVAHGQDAE